MRRYLVCIALLAAPMASSAQSWTVEPRDSIEVALRADPGTWLPVIIGYQHVNRGPTLPGLTCSFFWRAGSNGLPADPAIEYAPEAVARVRFLETEGPLGWSEAAVDSLTIEPHWCAPGEFRYLGRSRDE